MTSNAQKAPLPWLIIACGCLITALTFGPRSAMGFFQLPMLADTGWDRTTFGLAMALQNLCWGIGQPLIGAVADRYGTWRGLSISALLYSAGLFLMAVAASPSMFYLGGGILVGFGVAAGSFGIIFAAFARNVPPEQRSFAFGLGTAAGSAGMFLFAPITQGMIDAYGWSDTLVYFAIVMLVIPVLAVALRGNAQSGTQSSAEYQQTVRGALQEAFNHQSYLLLVAGFFVCGFHVAFVGAHFPAYVSDIGVSADYAVWAFALIGFFNIIGSLGSGIIGQRYSKPMLLVWLYLSRSITMALFLLLPQSDTSVIIFSVVLGLLWLSTVAPTNALVAVMFGTRHLGMLGGIVFFSHQVGSFLGVYLGGYLFDRFGTYDPVWWLAVILGLIAAALHWPIREAPVPRGAAVLAE